LRDLNDFGWFKDSGKGLKIGNFPPERWQLWPGMVATFKRNGGSFAPDYAVAGEFGWNIMIDSPAKTLTS